MKIMLFILIAITLLSAESFGQQLKPNSVTRGKTVSFRSDQDRNGNLIVVDSKNDFFSKKPKTGPANINMVIRKEKTMLTAFLQVFNDERLKQLAAERYMSMVCFVNPAGKVLGITFYLNKSTTVTALELEQLQKAIESNVSFTLNPDETRGGDFFPIAQIVLYEHVLKRSLK